MLSICFVPFLVWAELSWTHHGVTTMYQPVLGEMGIAESILVGDFTNGKDSGAAIENSLIPFLAPLVESPFIREHFPRRQDYRRSIFRSIKNDFFGCREFPGCENSSPTQIVCRGNACILNGYSNSRRCFCCEVGDPGITDSHISAFVNDCFLIWGRFFSTSEAFIISDALIYLESCSKQQEYDSSKSQPETKNFASAIPSGCCDATEKDRGNKRKPEEQHGHCVSPHNSLQLVISNIRLGVLMKKANVAFPDYVILCDYY